MPTIILATGNPHKVEELRAIFAALRTPHPSGPVITVLGLNDLPGHEHFREPEEIGATCEENARIKALAYAEQVRKGDQGIGGSGDQGRRSLDSAISRSPDCSFPDPPIPRSLDPRFPLFLLADDSGIEIDALRLPGPPPHGTPRPGVISSHYRTDGVERGMSRGERDAANNARVLREMEHVPEARRTARFVCCMCLTGIGSRESGAGKGKSAAAHSLHETRGAMEGRIGIPPRVPAGSNGFGYDPLFLVAPEYIHTGAELSSDEKNRLSHRGMATRRMVEWLISRLTVE